MGPSLDGRHGSVAGSGARPFNRAASSTAGVDRRSVFDVVYKSDDLALCVVAIRTAAVWPTNTAALAGHRVRGLTRTSNTVWRSLGTAALDGRIHAQQHCNAGLGCTGLECPGLGCTGLGGYGCGSLAINDASVLGVAVKPMGPVSDASDGHDDVGRNALHGGAANGPRQHGNTGRRRRNQTTGPERVFGLPL